jgi:phosphoglycerate dehydrogenase-like enzyme
VEFNFLARTPSRILLSNISRGTVIDQNALIDALKSGIPSGAAVDVADPEPLLKDNPQWTAPNLFVRPHISSTGSEYLDVVLQLFELKLEKLPKGDKLINVRQSS